MPTPEDIHDHPRRRPPAIEGEELASLVAALGDLVVVIRELADHAPIDPRHLLRAEEVARLLQLPVRTVRDRAAAGAIPHRRFGKHYRFSLADVDQIVQSMERAPRQRPRSLRAVA